MKGCGAGSRGRVLVTGCGGWESMEEEVDEETELRVKKKKKKKE